MSISVIAFSIMANGVILFAAAALVSEWDFKVLAWNQKGDSSLSPKSMNWLAGIAFTAALLICLA